MLSSALRRCPEYIVPDTPHLPSKGETWQLWSPTITVCRNPDTQKLEICTAFAEWQRAENECENIVLDPGTDVTYRDDPPSEGSFSVSARYFVLNDTVTLEITDWNFIRRHRATSTKPELLKHWPPRPSSPEEELLEEEEE